MALMHVYMCASGILACLDGYMNIAMEQTEVGALGAGTTKPDKCVGSIMLRDHMPVCYN